MNRLFAVSAALALALLTGCRGNTHLYISPVGPELPPKYPFSQSTVPLEAFDSVDIDVLAADVNLVAGDSWSLSYALSDREPLDTLEVTDGTLYVKTQFGEDDWIERRSDWFITITVPSDASFTDVEIDTVTSNIASSGVACDAMALFSNAGSIAVDSADAETLSANALGGTVKVLNSSAASAELDSICGSLEVSGNFGQLNATTINGRITAAADITVSGELFGASGTTLVHLKRPSALDLFCTGTLTLNGETVETPLTVGEGVPVSIHALSGNLTVYTAD